MRHALSVSVLVLPLGLALLCAPLDQAFGAPVPSQTVTATPAEPDAGTVTAERALVRAQLVGLGLTQSEAADRVALLTDAEVHAVAGDPNAVQLGGTTPTQDGIMVGILIAVLIVNWRYLVSPDSW